MKAVNFFLYAWAGSLGVALVFGIAYAIYQLVTGNVSTIYI